MELDREQIINDLDCFRHRILHSKLAEQVYGKEMLAIIDAIALINELSEENERLQDLVKEEQQYNEAWVEDNGKLRRELKTIKADTIRHMQEKLLYEWDWCAYDADEAPYVINQVAKEMLGEKR